MTLSAAIIATIVCVVFFVVGLLMVIGGIRLKGNCTQRVNAVVVDMEEKVDEDEDGTSVSYYPVFEYIVDGVPYRVQSSFGSSGRRYGIGQEVTLMYNPDNPHQFLERGESKATVLMGGLLVLISPPILWYAWSLR